MPFEDSSGRIDEDAHIMSGSSKEGLRSILRKLQGEESLTEKDRQNLREIENLDEKIEEKIEKIEDFIESGYTRDDLSRQIKALHKLIEEREEMEHREEEFVEKLEELEAAIENQS